MSNPPTKHEPLLTLDDVRAKRKEIVLGEKELVRISAKLDADRKEFQQMLVFVPEALRERILSDDSTVDMFGKVEEPERDLTPLKYERPAIRKPPALRRLLATRTTGGAGQKFSAFITDLVRKSTTGLGHTELKEAVQNSEFASRLEDQARAYHRTIGKLVARNDIIRHGGRFYFPGVYEVLRKTGKLPEVEEGVSIRENGAAKLTLEVLQNHPQGLNASDLKVLVGANKSAPKSVTEHGQYIYNVLATLVGSGRVVKNGALYQIAEKETPRANGASGTHASEEAR